MAVASAHCHLRSLFLKKKRIEGAYNNMWASTNSYGIGLHVRQSSSLQTLFNPCSLRSLNGKGFCITKTGINHTVAKQSAGENDLGLLGFSKINPKLFKTFPNRVLGLKKNKVCREKTSASPGATNCESEVKDSEDCEGEEGTKSNLERCTPPRYVWRALAAGILAGQVIARAFKGRIHLGNSLHQLQLIGPGSAGVCLLTAAFVGMAFTIQFVREFTRLGLMRSVGGVLALALSRELAPVVTSIIIAGRVGSAFAAELGAMQVSEQIDTLWVLGTDPVDYLVTPRVIACCVALPTLTLICFTVAMAASVLLAGGVYNVSANIILDSAKRALHPWDVFSAMIKSAVFGGIVSVISCAWGVTTVGGAKGVGESTPSAVVISLVCIFIADFVLSWCFFQGAGDALKAAMG
eukprot:Gb_36360 [translate_table: standard]